VTSKIQKYSIHGTRCETSTIWWARVPYGTFRKFSTWEEAAGYLRLRHTLKEGGKR
jgi:hypothetical protein